MIPVKVKICGITNLEDAEAAIDLRADILGFNFFPKSPRYIEPEKAMEIIAKLPAHVDIAGVFVNAEPQTISALANPGMINWVQFHGDESPDFCHQFKAWNLRTIKAVRVKDAASVKEAEAFQTSALLFDAFNPKLYGGTGETFDWSLVKNCPQRIFLAGGITPDNVQKALEQDIYGVDVCSGIEAEPGKKDQAKMKKLFENIRNFTG
ncbi:MAG: phosphoribosylanthranilate isomerase [Planctomycetota bacterium]|jgi:phosphoribosylanthranilate isomerase